MVEWSQLLLPIVLSAVFVFVVSSVIHMVLKWHNPEYGKLQNEDSVRAAFAESMPPPGQYIIPHCVDPKEGAQPEMMRKFDEGPVAVIWVRASGQMKLGPFLGKWFLFTLIVSALAAYIARSQLQAGAEFKSVFQLVGATTWLAYSFGGPADSIWMGKPWTVTIKHMVDGLAYGLATAAAFAWLWPN